MRNKLSNIVVIAISLCWAMQSIAADFIATVDSYKIAFGNSVQLKLSLIDAKATSNLDISALAKDFTIYQQQQISSYSNINGRVHAENGWHVILIPKRTGELIIPEIILYTDQGVLATQPVTIHVENAKTGSAKDKANVGITLVASINKAKVYVNEPAIYTLKIVSYKPIANVVLDDVKSNDAIIEKLGDPKQYDQYVGGMRAHIIEIRYSVSALKSGKITIPPVLMQGELQVPSQTARNQRYSMFNHSMFDNMFELKPFSMQSEPITINVLEPIGKASEWLPVNNFTLTQTWDIPKDLKVGDTITRKVKMVAKGGFAKQLPSTKDAQQVDNVKVYANKPNFTEKYEEGSSTIIGVKEEEFSIVPQSEGSITFPAIQIKWWNIKTGKHETSTLPAKTITVDVAKADKSSAVTLDFSAQTPQQIDAPKQVETNTNKSVILYVIIGILAGVFITVLAVIFFINIKKRSFNNILPKVKKKDYKQELQQIKITTVEDLRTYILNYAHKNWKIEIKAHLNRLGDTLTSNKFSYDLEAYADLMQQLNTALYAGKSIDMSEVLAQWEVFKKSVVKIKANSKESATDYSPLNPT